MKESTVTQINTLLKIRDATVRLVVYKEILEKFREVVYSDTGSFEERCVAFVDHYANIAEQHEKALSKLKVSVAEKPVQPERGADEPSAAS